MNSRGNILLVGPLSEATEKVEEIASGLFTSLMMLESMERLEAAEQEYKTACNSDNPQAVIEKELQLKACETTVQITVAMLDNGEGVSQ